jgi:hypothetical protein
VKSLLREVYYRLRPAHLTFFVKPLLTTVSPARLVKVDAGNATQHQLLLAQVLVIGAYGPQQIDQRLKQGHLLFVDVQALVVRGYFWVSEDNLFVPWEKDTEILIPPNSRYIWDCRVDQTFRNQGIYKLGLQELSQSQTSTAEKKVYIYCLTSNKPSHAAIVSTGYSPVAEITVFRLAFQRIFAKGKNSQLILGPKISIYQLTSL